MFLKLGCRGSSILAPKRIQVAAKQNTFSLSRALKSVAFKYLSKMLAAAKSVSIL